MSQDNEEVVVPAEEVAAPVEEVAAPAVEEVTVTPESNEPLESTPATEEAPTDESKPVGPATIVELETPAEQFPAHDEQA